MTRNNRMPYSGADALAAITSVVLAVIAFGFTAGWLVASCMNVISSSFISQLR